MGALTYFYFVPYNPDFNKALQELRNREFKAGRYNPVIPFPDFPVSEDSPSPGPEHESIEDAVKAAMSDGTRSILDLDKVSNESGNGIARVLSDDELIEYFDTARIEKSTMYKYAEFPLEIERGQGFCLPLYDNGEPVELLFFGMSYD